MDQKWKGEAVGFRRIRGRVVPVRIKMTGTQREVTRVERAARDASTVGKFGALIGAAAGVELGLEGLGRSAPLLTAAKHLGKTGALGAAVGGAAFAALGGLGGLISGPRKEIKIKRVKFKKLRNA
jgi:hypothetical protein